MRLLGIILFFVGMGSLHFMFILLRNTYTKDEIDSLITETEEEVKEKTQSK